MGKPVTLADLQLKSLIVSTDENTIATGKMFSKMFNLQRAFYGRLKPNCAWISKLLRN